METATFYAISNDGEWQHVADDWSDLGTMLGEEILIGQCDNCGGHSDQHEDGTAPVVLLSENLAECKGCGQMFEVQEIQWCSNGSAEWHITDPDQFHEETDQN